MDNKNGFEEILTKFTGSPRNPYGAHCSYEFKGGVSGYRRAWVLHFSQVNGGALTPEASGPIRGTIRRIAMIAANMKPSCKVKSSDSVAPRKGEKSPLEGSYPERPSDYGLSSWKSPSDAPDPDKAKSFTCEDLNLIKEIAAAEVKRRINDREKKEDLKKNGGSDKTVMKKTIEKDWSVDFIKVEEEKRLVTGVVVEPETEDTYGDIISPEEIEKAMIGFMEKGPQIRVQHDMNFTPKVAVIENWIEREGKVIGENFVKAGTWLMTTKINDDEVWEMIKAGKLNGYSFHGPGIGVPA